MTRALAHLASLRLTLGLLAGVAVLLGWSLSGADGVLRWLAVPFALLGANLLAAIAVHERLRRQSALFAFHLGLASLALVAAVGRLLAFDGHVEVTAGAGLDFDQVVADSHAPFHALRLDRIAFVQRGFSIDYDANLQRRETRSTVALPDGQGGWVERIVGDDHPLVIDGYRFYTTPNKGFALLLTWADSTGGAASGSVHLPSYPMHADNQGNEFALPDGSRNVVLWLELERPILDETRPWSFRPPETARLVVIDGERRETLAPGQSIEFGGNRLRYDGLTTWMGYRIFYDPSLPWLLAAAAVTAISLAVHALMRLRGLTDGPAWREVDHVR